MTAASPQSSMTYIAQISSLHDVPPETIGVVKYDTNAFTTRLLPSR